MASGSSELVLAFDDGTRDGRVTVVYRTRDRLVVTCEPNDEPGR